MARNPNYFISRSYVDASNENSNVQVNIVAYNVLSFADVLTGISQLWAAVDAVTLMNPIQDSITLYSTKFSKVIPTDPNAQRERKMLISFEDATNFTPGRIEIPGPDFSVVPLLPGTDIFDLADTQMAALVTAIESQVRSADGNEVNVIRANAVGRNL
jgi:hypothetical protein